MVSGLGVQEVWRAQHSVLPYVDVAPEGGGEDGCGGCPHEQGYQLVGHMGLGL